MSDPVETEVIEESTPEVVEETVVEDKGSIDDLLGGNEAVEETVVEEEVVVDPNRPEWLPEGYSKPEDMVSAMTDMQEKLGSFTGSPEEYSFEVPEGIQLIDGEEGGLSAFKAVAKEMGVSQEGFDKLMGTYMESENVRASLLNNQRMDTIHESYGSKEAATKAFSTVNARTEAVLGKDGSALLKDALVGDPNSSLAVIKLVEGLLNKSQGEEFTQSVNVQASPAMNADKLTSMYNDPRMKTDAGYRNQVTKEYGKFYNK